MLLGYISGIDPALEASARVLGRPALGRLPPRDVALIAPGAAIAFALVFVMNFGVFPSAVLVGQPAGQTRTIASPPTSRPSSTPTCRWPRPSPS